MWGARTLEGDRRRYCSNGAEFSVLITNNALIYLYFSLSLFLSIFLFFVYVEDYLYNILNLPIYLQQSVHKIGWGVNRFHFQECCCESVERSNESQWDNLNGSQGCVAQWKSSSVPIWLMQLLLISKVEWMKFTAALPQNTFKNEYKVILITDCRSFVCFIYIYLPKRCIFIHFGIQS